MRCNERVKERMTSRFRLAVMALATAGGSLATLAAPRPVPFSAIDLQDPPRQQTQLAQQDGITAVEIGFTLDIEKSTLSRNLNRLLKLGHITMDPPAGRRGRGQHLTPKGQGVIKKGYPVWLSAQQRATNVMGADSRSILDSLLQHAEKLAVA